MFRDRIKESYDSLTTSFKRLAEFIINHELDVAFMTATQLAHALDVDAATVVRFSQTLGYTGYRELSHEIQRVVKADLIATYGGFDEAETEADRLRTLIENERHNLEIATTQITDKAAELLDMLVEAKRVWVVGDATGQCLARVFAQHLRMAGINAFEVDADPAAAASEVTSLGTGDVVIGIGVAGTGLDTAAVLHYAKEKGATVAAISYSLVSPPALAADYVYICPSTSPIGISSPACVMTVLMILWQALMARDKEAMQNRVQELQHAYADLVARRAAENDKVELEQILIKF